jgi:hypothetical protein
MLTYADVCWRMLRYDADTDRALVLVDTLGVLVLTYADVCWRMLTYAADTDSALVLVDTPGMLLRPAGLTLDDQVCGRMRTYADVCGRMLTYADVLMYCKQRISPSILKDILYIASLLFYKYSIVCFSSLMCRRHILYGSIRQHTVWPYVSIRQHTP